MPEDTNKDQAKEELAAEEKENKPIEYVYGYVEDTLTPFYKCAFLYSKPVDAFMDNACKSVYFVTTALG